MQTHESAEDYLERILMLKEQGEEEIHAVDLALSLGFSKPSVSIALKKLISQNLVYLGPKQDIHLTDEGLAIASKIFERHKIISSLLISWGVDKDVALADACKIEHDLSDETFEAIKNHYLNIK
jgi:Mn-dependent DtxR family transcriptional regulator